MTPGVSCSGTVIATSAVVAEALRALVERESARRLAPLGASQPGLAAPPRR